jgi:hypothetical protein
MYKLGKVIMSRKFYVAMAKSFRENIKDYDQRNAAVVAYCEIAKQHNPRFDMIKFRIASGV